VEVALPAGRASALVAASTPLGREPLVLGAELARRGALALAALAAVRRQRELSRTRALFVATVSHELRTPLAHVTALSETMLLGRAESPEQARRWLHAIHREGRRLTTLTENLLLHVRGEQQALRVVPRRTDVGELAHEVAALVAPMAQARSARVAVDAPAGCEVPLDPDLMRQVLLNLLDNAIKFGGEGQTVRLAAAVERRAVVLVVDDEGPGIPAAQRDRVWAPFARLETAADGAAGTGLGLSVVHQLVAAHGGTARVADAPSGGARFVVRLPLGG
ncbi:HAMP domain-containing sensor histidine kinase, partial [Roseisolibacter sp. H3M3-2]|uniref:sensor histidine kinase n=1 Tax=Roseisolibacter sp. H3M3-2 TaxID=3031323 RepID=UPI0023DAEDA8